MHTTTTPIAHHSARRIRNAIAAGAIGLLACGSLGACGASTPGATSGTSTTTVAKHSQVATTVTTTEPAGPSTVASNGNANRAPGGGGQVGGNNGNPSGGGSGGGGSNTAPAPVITGFTTPENIDCHNGNLQNFTLSWTTQNATKVTISIDGPGIYDTYGPSGDASLPFNCSSSHTFLLTAYSADGKTTTKQVTLQPRNVQAPDSGDDAS
jgi:hypothetical protein